MQASQTLDLSRTSFNPLTSVPNALVMATSVGTSLNPATPEEFSRIEGIVRRQFDHNKVCSYVRETTKRFSSVSLFSGRPLGIKFFLTEKDFSLEMGLRGALVPGAGFCMHQFNLTADIDTVSKWMAQSNPYSPDGDHLQIQRAITRELSRDISPETKIEAQKSTSPEGIQTLQFTDSTSGITVKTTYTPRGFAPAAAILSIELLNDENGIRDLPLTLIGLLGTVTHGPFSSESWLNSQG